MTGREILCGLVAIALGCAAGRGAPAVRPSLAGDADPRSVLDRFTAAVEAGRFEEAYPLLSARWRARETPARLGADLAAAGPAGRDAVARVRALLAADAPVRVEGDLATLAVGERREARLTREDGAWRVDALE